MEKEKRLGRNGEFYLLLAMILFCAVLAWQISVITVPESRIFPLFILVVTGAATVLQALHVFWKKDFLDIRQALLSRREWVAFLVLLLSCFCFDILGFYATIFLVLIAVSLLVQPKLTKKAVISSLVFDVILLGVLYLCFGMLLKLATPTGIFY